ncbi:MAG: dephospho-CoA kinase [Ruminiclostridium sp.]|nr:dephospho-CoA kinase [Ruminiclostridium sp.]
MRIIGVTGAIGSGKSIVSKILNDLGAVIVDADILSRTVTAKGSDALGELVSYFGEEILMQNGELDRQKLADIVFNDKVKLHALNAITHKHIVKRIQSAIDNIKAAGKCEVIALDAPIPIEHGFIDIVDEVWVVTADGEKRKNRIMERSGYTLEEAESRLDSQMTDEEYLRLADEILENNGEIEELEKSVVRLFFQKVLKQKSH